MKNAASVFFVGFPGVRVSGEQCLGIYPALFRSLGKRPNPLEHLRIFPVMS